MPVQVVDDHGHPRLLVPLAQQRHQLLIREVVAEQAARQHVVGLILKLRGENINLLVTYFGVCPTFSRRVVQHKDIGIDARQFQRNAVFAAPAGYVAQGIAATAAQVGHAQGPAFGKPGA